MQLTTLMELLELEIGVSPSARSQLAVLVAERRQRDLAAPAQPKACEARTQPRTPKRAGRRTK